MKTIHFHFLLKYLLHPMGVIEVSYGCNRTPSEEPGVNGSYSTPKSVLQTPFFNSVYKLILIVFIYINFEFLYNSITPIPISNDIYYIVMISHHNKTST